MLAPVPWPPSIGSQAEAMPGCPAWPSAPSRGGRGCHAASAPGGHRTVVGKVLDLLMDGLEELTLVFPNPGVVWLPHQPGVFVDEPRLPENVSSGVFHLGGGESIPCFATRETEAQRGQLITCTWLPGPIIPASHCTACSGAVTGHTWTPRLWARSRATS